MADSKIRDEVLANAVAFLTDPSVADTPLTKKIQFLESKGMTNAEIQHAMVQAQGGMIPASNAAPGGSISANAGTPPVPAIPQQLPPYNYYSPPPAPRNYDWKDYVIMGTTTAGFVYGAYQIVSRYVLPKVIPPAQSKLDEDKEAMEREFQRVEAILEKLESDQTEFINRQDEKSQKIDEALIEIDAIVKSTNEKNLRNEETLKYLKLEIDSIKTTLLKNLESQKNTISNEFQQLEQKTDSIKESLSQMTFTQQDESKKTPVSFVSTHAAPSQSPTPPPPNLLTNNRSTSSISVPQSTSYSNLNIPPPSSVPSAKDILGNMNSNSSDSKTEIVSPVPITNNSGVNNPTNIPAWQLAATQKANLNDDKASIPAWQLAAQNK